MCFTMFHETQTDKVRPEVAASMGAQKKPRSGAEVQDIRDAVCLDALNDGISVQTLALITGRSRITIWRWIKRARDNPDPPNLEIWCNNTGKACIHGRPIVPGMPVLCVDCIEKGNIDGCTGVPTHPAMRKVKYREKPKDPPKSKALSGTDGKVVWELPATGQASTATPAKAKETRR